MFDGSIRSFTAQSDPGVRLHMKQGANQRGAVLLFLLLAVVIMGLMAGVAGSTWKTIVQREREAELLWRGNQYRQAIGSYYTTDHAGSQHLFPNTLEQLVRDPRTVATVRHIRKLYPDPVTGKEWELIKDNTGRIQGVRSVSEEEPFKKDKFSEEDKEFVGKKSYSEWRFVYTPEKTKQNESAKNKPQPAKQPGQQFQLPGNNLSN